ncbi:hypothetical protein [Egbenema bharatensis]|uniref:hypothetical protein n=1 Tax=Egbenema bharatensis TaxID=3463334 RepID=UPI003A871861
MGNGVGAHSSAPAQEMEGQEIRSAGILTCDRLGMFVGWNLACDRQNQGGSWVL